MLAAETLRGNPKCMAGGGPSIPIWKTGLGTLAVLLCGALAVQVWNVRGLPGGAGRAVFGLGLLLLGGQVAGHLAAMVRLPRLTGYLLAGVLAGPHGLRLLGTAEVHALEMINALALALIALQAGAELTLAGLRGGLRSLWHGSVMQLLVLMPGLGLVFVAVKPLLPFAQALDTSGVVAAALVWSAVGISKSPAVTLAVLGETRARGPLTDYAMRMVVAFDVLVLLVFAVAMLMARTLLEPGATMELSALQTLGVELVASVAAGTTLGMMVSVYLATVEQGRGLFILCLAYGLTAFCRYFHYDTLLVFVVLGFMVQNFSRQGHGLVEVAQKTSSVVMVVFFATAGAHLDVALLRASWQAALVLAGARVLLTWVSCRLGHRAAADEAAVTQGGWTSLVSQAGVTLGLLTLVAQNLPPPLGASMSALGIAVVGINELVGPVLFKWGLARAGEVNAGITPTGPEPHSAAG